MRLLIFCALILVIPAYSFADNPAGLSKSLRAVADRDTVCDVWVFFRDRGASDGISAVSERAALRRQRAGFRGDQGDRPIRRIYIEEVERLGGSLRHTFAWGNAASFSVGAPRLADIAALPFVKFVSPVAVYVRKGIGGAGFSKSAGARSAFGGYGWNMEMVNVPMAHEYLKAKGLGDPGAGIIVAFFDSGFRLGHNAFSRVREKGSVVSAYDFVDNDGTVGDPDSVAGDPRHPYHQADRHGTQVMALVGGYDPGNYMGAAWGARYLLARTEDDAAEARVEEDNWAAAVVWAESLGADIISSSLGYRDGFDDPADDYGYEDMDGATAVISIAAAGAVARGMAVVNAAGNEGNRIPGTLIAPADVDGVVSVGAVNSSRALAGFSSVGPTFDGRVKPDVAAPGVSVPLPEPYGPGGASYTTGNGTSFAAPIVSGILAMIMQAHTGIGPDSARARLYASCSFAPGQTEFDNRFGRGVPDALRAVMGDGEIFIKLSDSAGIALQGAQVKIGADTHTANESGVVVAGARGLAFPLEVKISFQGAGLRTLAVDSLPFAASFAFNVKRDDGLRVFPRAKNKNGVIKGRYYFPAADASKRASVAIHAVNGRTVWSQRLQLRPDGSAEFAWNGRAGAGRVAAGVYLLTVRHGGNLVSERIIVR